MKKVILFTGIVLAGLVNGAYAVNNAPADVAVIALRTSCFENGGAKEVPNCFDSINAVDNWLLNVRQAGSSKPTLVDVGPGTFLVNQPWYCKYSDVTIRGSGRERSFIQGTAASGSAMFISDGCTRLNVQDISLVGTTVWGVAVFKLDSVTSWTNVEIRGPQYAWVESIGGCSSNAGKHQFFSSRIVSTGSGSSRAYTATCAQSWFWGSEITAIANTNENSVFALEAHDAEIHLYGSNVRMLLNSSTTASGFTSTTGHYLIAALVGSDVHIHGTGLDVVHPGSGTADLLYADASSHFHANESGMNIHITGTGKVRRVGGAGEIESPYTWGSSTQPPLNTPTNGVHKLISRNGSESYIETDCPLSGNCSSGGNYPHLMIYRSECTGTGINQGPWFDTVTKACRG